MLSESAAHSDRPHSHTPPETWPTWHSTTPCQTLGSKPPAKENSAASNADQKPQCQAQATYSFASCGMLATGHVGSTASDTIGILPGTSLRPQLEKVCSVRQAHLLFSIHHGSALGYELLCGFPDERDCFCRLFVPGNESRQQGHLPEG